MSTVSSQIQRAISKSISDQILPQIQATFITGQGHVPEMRWGNPARRPKYRSDEALDRGFRSVDQPRRVPHVKLYLPKQSQYGKRASQS